MAAELEEGGNTTIPLPSCLDISSLKISIEYYDICFALSSFTPVYDCQNYIFNSYAISRSNNHHSITSESTRLRTLRLARDKFFKCFVDAMYVLGGALVKAVKKQAVEKTTKDLKEDAPTTSVSKVVHERVALLKTKGNCKLCCIISEWREICEILELSSGVEITKKEKAQTTSTKSDMEISKMKDDRNLGDIVFESSNSPEEDILCAMKVFEPEVKAIKSLGDGYYQQNKDTENQRQFYVPKCFLDQLVEYCARRGVGRAKAQAKAHCRTIIGTSLKHLQVDKELDISTKYDGISVMSGQSEYSLYFEDHAGEVAASLCSSSVSKDSFQSSIAGGDEVDGERVTRQRIYSKKSYPRYRILLKGRPFCFDDHTGEYAADLQQLTNSSSESLVSEDSFQSGISGDDEGDDERDTRQKYYRKIYRSGYPAYRIHSLQTKEHPHICEYSSSSDGSKYDRISVMGGQSEYSLFVEDHTGELAADLKHFSITESGISGDDEGDGDSDLEKL